MPLNIGNVSVWFDKDSGYLRFKRDPGIDSETPELSVDSDREMHIKQALIERLKL